MKDKIINEALGQILECFTGDLILRETFETPILT